MLLINKTERVAGGKQRKITMCFYVMEGDDQREKRNGKIKRD